MYLGHCNSRSFGSKIQLVAAFAVESIFALLLLLYLLKDNTQLE